MRSKTKSEVKSPIHKCKLKTGDEVIVITGRDKGKKGNIQLIDRKKGKLQIPQINLVKKHRRATQENRTGEVVEIPSAISMSNVMIFCPKCSTGVRIKLSRENGKKQRHCHRCGYLFDKK
jgi:large subunit ribosomal protein L24